MRHVYAIAKRELLAYFVSPIAYAALTAFVLLSGYFFNSMVVYYIRQGSLADRQLEAAGRSALQLDVPTVILQNYFTNQGGFVLLLILPLLTMGLLTDERRKGTLELLLTSPIRSMELTLGKFFGALTFFAETLAEREGAGFLRYGPGGFYGPHRDRGIVPSWPGAERRSIAVVIFLNDGFGGGVLRLFGDAGARDIVPREGTLAAFPAATLHEVASVIDGTRDTVVDWFY